MFGLFGLSRFERNILDHVKRAGCHINYVFDDKGADPPFGYSVGFPETVKQPEVIIFGMTQELTGGIINEVMTRCRDGFQLGDGAVISDLLGGGHDLIVRVVPPNRISEEHFNSAIWYHERATGQPLTKAVQIVWPSAKTGLFPWQAGSDQEFRLQQPALYEEIMQ